MDENGGFHQRYQKISLVEGSREGTYVGTLGRATARTTGGQKRDSGVKKEEDGKGIAVTGREGRTI